jgi:hypothetical protein
MCLKSEGGFTQIELPERSGSEQPSAPTERGSMTLKLVWPLAGSLLVCACGGAAVPHDRLSNAQASVRAAEVAGAKEDPKASLQLKRAQDQVDEAKALIADNRNEAAARVLMRAEADADLAIALAQEQASRAEAARAQKEVADLRAQLKKQNKK